MSEPAVCTNRYHRVCVGVGSVPSHRRHGNYAKEEQRYLLVVIDIATLSYMWAHMLPL